jgi:hypothetical protein
MLPHQPNERLKAVLRLIRSFRISERLDAGHFYELQRLALDRLEAVDTGDLPNAIGDPDQVVYKITAQLSASLSRHN